VVIAIIAIWSLFVAGFLLVESPGQANDLLKHLNRSIWVVTYMPEDKVISA